MEETMEGTRWERVAAIGGFAFVVFTVVATLLPGTPPAVDDSARKIGDWFRDHTGAIEVGQVLAGVGIIGLSWWFGSLWRMMRRAEGGEPRLSVVALLGLGLGASLALLSGAVNSGAALRINELGDGGAQTFFTMSTVMISTAGFGIVVFLGAVCALNYRTAMFPPWTTYLGWLAAIGFLISTLGSASDSMVFGIFGLIGFFVWAVWIVCLSVYMWRAPAGAAT